MSSSDVRAAWAASHARHSRSPVAADRRDQSRRRRAELQHAESRNALPRTQIAALRRDAQRASRQPRVITHRIADAVARAAPAVVSIYANRMVTGRRVLVPTDPLLRRMFGVDRRRPDASAASSSLGSGVIVSADGYVLTNNHVIEGAEEIEAMLNDGRVAKATRRRQRSGNRSGCAQARCRQSADHGHRRDRRLRVGDVVLAIGNPFGLGNTVTMGIVSALGRQLHKSTYEDFIQTDAAINEGNSGGALVNAYGELVGINSDVFSPRLGRPNRHRLRDSGRHGQDRARPDRRPWQGDPRLDRRRLSATAPLCDQTATPARPQGVTVTACTTDGPAAQAGLQRGDVLLQLNGEPITGPARTAQSRGAASRPAARCSCPDCATASAVQRST